MEGASAVLNTKAAVCNKEMMWEFALNILIFQLQNVVYFCCLVDWIYENFYLVNLGESFRMNAFVFTLYYSCARMFHSALQPV